MSKLSGSQPVQLTGSALQPGGLFCRVFLMCLFVAMPAVVQSKTGLDDAMIAAAVEEELLWDHGVPSNRIDVSVRQGIARLTGEVTNLRARNRATQLAELVKGVRGVVNEIDVKRNVASSGDALAWNVRDALFADPATESYEIAVSADETGKVTLGGQVQSWAEKELAATVASGVTGVTELVNDIEVNFDRDRPDSEIEQEIEARLRWDALVDHAMLDVAVRNGRVKLSGTVGSAAERARAAADAWIAGVRDVDESAVEIAHWARDDELRDEKYVVKSDAEIERAIKAALNYDPRVSAFEIRPSVTDGMVTLFGVVDNAKAKQAAAMDARNVVGVRRIKNRLKVRPLPALTDDEILDNVNASLRRDAFVDAEQIKVDVTNGTAQLRGVVDSTYEKAQAQDAAFRAKGVESVINYLDVAVPEIVSFSPYVYDWSIYDYGWYQPGDYTALKSDRSIKEDIENHLFWSPFVDEEDITVNVEDGTAILSGTVQSWREYNAATENAIEGGASRVRNQLSVNPG